VVHYHSGVQTFAYLRDPLLSGAENMGRDEALLRMATADSRPVLRTYGWSPATISLGYFQDYSEVSTLSNMTRDLPVVRRSTGGGAILHDQELTYSLVMPLSHPFIAGRPNELYSMVHHAIARAIAGTVENAAKVDMHEVLHPGSNEGRGASSQRGPFYCFARRHAYDVVAERDGGHTVKLAGSAQRRTTTAVLQHGSIMLGCRFEEQPCATWSGCAHRSINMEEAVECFVGALASTLGVAFAHERWSDAALAEAERHRQWHASDAWLHDRTRPE